MSKIQLEKQEAQPIDEATRAALEQVRAELRRGEGVTLEAAQVAVKKQHQAWRKTPKTLVNNWLNERLNQEALV